METTATASSGDNQKTRAELLGELERLRRRVAALKRDGGPPADGHSEERNTRSHRTEIHTDIEFIGDFDILRARGINLSEGGICFEVSDPLLFEMQFELNGVQHRHRARLVWMKRISEGRHCLGLQFLPARPTPDF